MSKQVKSLDDQHLILPNDIIQEIPLRVSVKSIDQFKCVSKSWQSLLSSSLFVKQYLDFRTFGHDHDHIISVSPSLYPDLLTFTDENGNGGISRKLEFPHLKRRRYLSVAGSCHGLVLLIQDFRDLGGILGILANPVTLEATPIPQICLPWKPDWTCRFKYGLGHDSSKNDFKIVSISCLVTSPRNLVFIYSLKTKTWRNLGDSTYEPMKNVSGVFVNGCLYWVSWRKGENKTCVIAAFNLATEEFEVIPYPRGFETIEGSAQNLIVLGGCLAMVIGSCERGSFESSADVWLMKEHGMQDSWTKFTIYISDHHVKVVGRISQFRVICFLNKDEVLLVEYGKNLFVYNCRNGVLRRLNVDDAQDYIHRRHSISFKKSLISPYYN